MLPFLGKVINPNRRPYIAHFLKVGCADCTILELGEKCVVIDCGYRRKEKIINRPFNFHAFMTRILRRNTIDLLIITHPHHDHFLGIQDLINHVKVNRFWGSPYKRRNGDSTLTIEEWKEYLELKEKLVPAANRSICYKGAQIEMGGCIFRVLGPRRNVNNGADRECHDANLVIQISTPLENIIICGDASSRELEIINSDWNLEACTILKASHHGSINGLNVNFLQNARAREIVIPTAGGIFSKLPHFTAMRQYRNNCKKLIRTDLNGTYKVLLSPLFKPPPLAGFLK